MTIDELGELAQNGFDGLNERLDALNGRVRKTEVAVGQLHVSARAHDETGRFHDERLRAVEQRSAVSAALVADLKRTSRLQGIKWGAVASAAMVVALYGVAHYFGIPIPR